MRNLDTAHAMNSVRMYVDTAAAMYGGVRPDSAGTERNTNTNNGVNCM